MNSAFGSASPMPSRWWVQLRAWLRNRSAGAGPWLAGAPDVTAPPATVADDAVRVLVVDDNPVNLVWVSSLLEKRGFVPLLAADGAEAVALASVMHFDLVLMDIQMPILDGLAATSAIRCFEADHARPSVPVIAYSGSFPSPDVLRTHGLNDQLTKPCDDAELEACLVRWCPTYQPAPARRVGPAP